MKTLAEVRQDIARMILPSWIGRVPSDLGNKSHGTLSQDALRTTITVTLVSSLPRLWGATPEGSRERAMLANFLDFAQGTDIALMRSTSVDEADRVHQLFLKFLRQLQVLYPHHGMVPNQHIMLHLSETMKKFGPAPGQRTNLLERINYLFQKMPTNSKSGQSDLLVIVTLIS